MLPERRCREGKPVPDLPSAPHRRSRKPPQAWALRAGDIVALGGEFNLGYAALLIYALTNPDAGLGVWVALWIQLARKVLEPAYVVAGHAGCGGVEASGFIARAWAFDVHLVVVNLVVTGGLFVASRSHWENWARQIHNRLGWRDSTPDTRREDEETGYGTLTWGAIAVLMWLILGSTLFDTAAYCSSFKPWSLLRTPLLTICAHGFACFAAVFWAGRDF